LPKTPIFGISAILNLKYLKSQILFLSFVIILCILSCKKDKPDTQENCRLKTVTTDSNINVFQTTNTVSEVEYNDDGEISFISSSGNSFESGYSYTYLYADDKNESILDENIIASPSTVYFLYHNDYLIEKLIIQGGLIIVGGTQPATLTKYKYDDQNRLVLYQKLNLYNVSSNSVIVFDDSESRIGKEKLFEYPNDNELVVRSTGHLFTSYSYTETYSKNPGDLNWKKCVLNLDISDVDGNVISTSERVFDFEYDNYPIVNFPEFEPDLSLNAAFNNVNNLIKISGTDAAYKLNIINDGYFCESLTTSCTTDSYEVTVEYVYDENDKLIEYHYRGSSKTPNSFRINMYYEYECD